MSDFTVAVLGAGQMGSGIAHVAALAGYPVVLRDISEAMTAKGLASIEKNMARQVKKAQITEAEATAAIGRITQSVSLDRLADASLVIEAATENLVLKTKIFQEADQVLHKDAILATNTSSISITALGAATSRPERVIGMHFMNPVPVMALVELIRGLATSDATDTTVRTVAEKMGKTVVASRDMPGFIVNRILMPWINEACFALGEGVASIEDIDTAMKLGTNVPMGPFALADLIGLDTCLSILEVLHRDLGESKYRPSPLLRKYVEAGWLGRKTGRGFHRY